MSIMNKLLVLKLNRSWMPVGFSTIKKAIIDLCADINCFALDIDYPIIDGNPDFSHPLRMNPVTWDEWVELPIRSWDIPLHSPSVIVRAPTVLVARNFDEMPIISYRAHPTNHQIYERDGYVDQYTGKSLGPKEISIDHVIPVSRGGTHTWENVVVTHKDINYKKGNKFNHEVGLKLIRQPKKPLPMPLSSLVRDVRHVDWQHFIWHKKK